jgi:hypothetical protein
MCIRRGSGISCIWSFGRSSVMPWNEGRIDGPVCLGMREERSAHQNLRVNGQGQIFNM